MASSWGMPVGKRAAGECRLERGIESHVRTVQDSFDCLMPDETDGFESVWSRTPSGHAHTSCESSASTCTATSSMRSGSSGGGRFDSATLMKKIEHAAANLQDTNLPGQNTANSEGWLSMCSTETVSPSTSTRLICNAKSRAADAASAPLGLMTLCVRLDPPHRIVKSSDNCLEFLGFSPREIVGKKLNVLQGPKTDAIELEILVERCTCEELTRHGKRIVLYKSDGEEVDARVSIRKVRLDFEGRDPIHACELSLQTKESIELGDEEEEFREDEDEGEDEDVELLVEPTFNLCCCTVRADERFTIETLSVPFMSMFGLLETQAIGRGISVIYSGRESKQAWTELLDVAVRTRMQTVQVVKVCDAFCDEFTATVRCSPIFSGDREVVERLHLVFESLEPNEQASLMSKFQGWCSGKWHCRDPSTSPSSARSGATTRQDSNVSSSETSCEESQISSSCVQG